MIANMLLAVGFALLVPQSWAYGRRLKQLESGLDVARGIAESQLKTLVSMEKKLSDYLDGRDGSPDTAEAWQVHYDLGDVTFAEFPTEEEARQAAREMLPAVCSVRRKNAARVPSAS